MSQEIQLYSKMADPIAAITKIGEMFARSGMFGCEKTEQGQVLALECLSTGKSPTEIIRRCYIIAGKLVPKATAMLADFRRAGGKHKWLKDGTDGKSAELELTFEGNTLVSKFSVDDAKRQGVYREGSQWIKSPANMLRARCISNGVVMLAPEIVAGDVDDGEEVSLPEKPLLTKKVETIDVVSETIDEKPETPAPTPATKTIFKAVAALKGGITTETVTALMESIGEENMETAFAWLLKQGWLKEGEAITALSQKHAQMILNKSDAFLKKVKSEVAK